jgi:phosphatidylglycerol:prolipoprotein diacylglycerol transferase
MYPNLKYLLEGYLGVQMPDWLRFVNTFGLFVAIGFYVGSFFLKAELKRKEDLHLLVPEKKFTRNGSIALIYPHERAGNMMLFALGGGLIGAKLFFILQNWQAFLAEPTRSLLSGGGFSFFGGLIVGGIILILSIRKHEISLAHFADAVAPALLLAYAIGRLGCHLSGDGDWGVFNSAYTTLPDGNLQAAGLARYQEMLQLHGNYFQSIHSHTVRDIYFQAPRWVPDWLVANNYPRNVIHQGMLLPGCSGTYCHVLPAGVYPTSLYEGVICTVLFAILWRARRSFGGTVRVFGLYLVMVGAERFAIEAIMPPSRAWIVSAVLVLAGLVLVMRKGSRERRAA